jgi:hypothetical protein
VLGLTDADMDQWSDVTYIFETDFYIPTVYHIGPDMTVLGADTYDADPSRYL